MAMTPPESFYEEDDREEGDYEENYRENFRGYYCFPHFPHRVSLMFCAHGRPHKMLWDLAADPPFYGWVEIGLPLKLGGRWAFTFAGPVLVPLTTEDKASLRCEDGGLYE
jgi:hypothetical protein